MDSFASVRHHRWRMQAAGTNFYIFCKCSSGQFFPRCKLHYVHKYSLLSSLSQNRHPHKYVICLHIKLWLDITLKSSVKIKSIKIAKFLMSHIVQFTHIIIRFDFYWKEKYIWICITTLFPFKKAHILNWNNWHILVHGKWTKGRYKCFNIFKYFPRLQNWIE